MNLKSKYLTQNFYFCELFTKKTYYLVPTGKLHKYIDYNLRAEEPWDMKN